MMLVAIRRWRRKQMRFATLHLVILAMALTGCAARYTSAGNVHAAQQPQPRDTPALRTLYIPAMGGYEKNVLNAIEAAKVPVNVIDERSKADLQVRPTLPNGRGSMGDVLYEKRTGHAPFSYLDVVELERNRVLLSYPFLWSDHEDTRNRDAQEFARELKKKLAPKTK
jgi:hypothetical protein